MDGLSGGRFERGYGGFLLFLFLEDGRGIRLEGSRAWVITVESAAGLAKSLEVAGAGTKTRIHRSGARCLHGEVITWVGSST